MAEHRGGLRSQQHEAELMARELMDMKIETAHLRERLRLRVGGDATAAELEAEAFALQTALSEAQQTLRAREAAQQELQTKYDKAMRGLLRLDEAWKLSQAQASDAQDKQQAAERLAEDQSRRGDELELRLKAAGERETTLASRVDAVTREKLQAEDERDEAKRSLKDSEMQTHELRAQLEATRTQFEAQMKNQEGATREDVRRLQEKLQQAEEQAAALRGEVHARQEEAAKVDAELRDVQAAEAAAKQRLVKLTEDHATLKVHLESAKLIAVESTQRAIQAEAENESLEKELEDREEELREKEQTTQKLEEELVHKQKMLAEELVKKKQALDETEGRLTKESQEMLQAQEEVWSCRERTLVQQVADYKQDQAQMQAFHVELAGLLQIKEDGDDAMEEQPTRVEPARLKALVVQEINKRDVLAAKLGRLKTKLVATKRQLGSQRQMEAENAKLRAEYDKAKLAMERMATRRGKSLPSTTSASVRPTGHDSSSGGSSERGIGLEMRPETGAVAPMVKRKLEITAETEASECRTTPRKAQRAKHVYVASRYLSSASKR